MIGIIERFPTKKEIYNVLMACAFPIFIWTIINTLVEIPAWILRLDTWDLIGIVAYTQAFALFESITVLVIFTIIGVILPARFFRNKFVAISTAVVFITALWVILAHYNDDIIREWGGKQFLFWIIIYSSSIMTVYFLIHRYRRFEEVINKLNLRLGVLSSIYIFIGIISVIIILIRNLL